MLRATLAAGAALFLAACPGSSQTRTQTDQVATGDQTGAQGGETDAPEAPKSKLEVFAADCRAGLEKARQILPTITQVQGKRTIENTLEPWNDLMIAIQESAGTAGLMHSVHPDAAVREEAERCEQDVKKFTSDLSLNQDVYQAFLDLDTSGFDAETKRLVEHTLRNYRRSGVDKDDKTRQRLAAIDEELTRLDQQFSKNVVEDVRYLVVDSADDLKGLPQDYIKSHQPGPDGKIKISTDYPDYFPFMSYADSEELRRQIYVEYKARGGEKNEQILGQILALRHEQANLLGYATWADYITEDKMMKSGANAAKFIERVVKIAEPRAKRDYQELLARKKKLDKKAKVVQDWEKTYIENKVKAESYAFDPQSVRPYFPYQQVERGLLDITSQIYDIEYQAGARRSARLARRTCGSST